MNKLIANKAWAILRFLGTGPLLLRIHPKSALLFVGWFVSFRKKVPVDKEMKPLPWWTYPAIAFLKDRINQNMSALEFGCGYSSIWLANRVASVISIEDDKKWASFVSSKLPKNGKVIISDYDSFVNLHDLNTKFDIIIIDAGNRLEIANNAHPFLKKDGVIIWDNTDGPDWINILGLMSGFGFKEISFQGMVAQEIALSRTTIFYKDKNCLNI